MECGGTGSTHSKQYEKLQRHRTEMLGIRWALENVSKIQEDSIVIGPNFYLNPEWIFRVSFEIKTNACLYLCTKSDAKIAIERKMALFDYNNKKLHEENDPMIFSLEKDKDVDIICDFVEREYFHNLPKDTLIIEVSVNIKEVVIKNLKLLVCDQDPKRKLTEDLKTMLENPVNSDISLVVGEERIAAHWSILCSRSSYFRKMFESGMKERVQNSVTITDISYCTLKKLIQFLYTADFIQRDDIQELFDLYYAADKCEVMDLRALCGRKIASNATSDNVCEILELSLRHNDKTLKTEAIGFIRSHSDAVFQTEGWKKFEKSDPGTAELISIFLQKI